MHLRSKNSDNAAGQEHLCDGRRDKIPAAAAKVVGAALLMPGENTVVAVARAVTRAAARLVADGVVVAVDGLVNRQADHGCPAEHVQEVDPAIPAGHARVVDRSGLRLDEEEDVQSAKGKNPRRNGERIVRRLLGQNYGAEDHKEDAQHAAEERHEKEAVVDLAQGIDPSAARKVLRLWLLVEPSVVVVVWRGSAHVVVDGRRGRDVCCLGSLLSMRVHGDYGLVDGSFLVYIF